MADTKISALTELTVPESGDFLPIVDTSSGSTKKVDANKLTGGVIYADDYTSLVSALATAAANASATNPYIVRCVTELITVTDVLDVPSYTTLDLNGAILKGDSSTQKSLIRNANWTSGDQQISIINGKLDYNYTVRGSASGVETHALRFYGVTGLTIKNLRIEDSQKYGIAAYLCTNVVVDDIYFNTNSDGVHFSLGGEYIYINNVRGSCGDDMIAFTIGEYDSYMVGSSFSDFKYINIQNAQSIGSDLAVVKMYGGRPEKQANTSIVDNADGTYTVTTAAAHNLVAGDLAIIEGSDVLAHNGKWTVSTTPTSTTWTYARATGDGNSTTHGTTGKLYSYEQISINSISGTADTIALKFGSEDSVQATEATNGLKYSNFKGINIRAINVDYVGTFLQFLQEGVNYIDYLILDISGTIVVNASNSFIANSGTGSTEIGILRIKNAKFTNNDSSYHGTVLNLSGTIIDDLYAENVVCDNLSTFLSQNNGELIGTNVYLSDFVYLNGNTGIQVRDELNIYLSNVRHSGNANRLIINQHAGAVASVYGSCMDVGTDNRTCEIAGFGSLYVYGPIRAQAADVTAAAGVYFYDVTAGKYTAYDGISNSAIN